MPWFYFDLTIDNHPRDQGGMIIENAAAAEDRADALAIELRTARPELQGKGCFIRVNDDDYTSRYGPLLVDPYCSEMTVTSAARCRFSNGDAGDAQEVIDRGCEEPHLDLIRGHKNHADAGRQLMR